MAIAGDIASAYKAPLRMSSHARRARFAKETLLPCRARISNLSRSGPRRTVGRSRCLRARQHARHRLAWRLQVRHEGNQGRGARRLGKESGPRLRALRLFGSRPVQRRSSPTERSGAGSRRASPSSNAFVTGRRFWSAPPWAAGSRCCWRVSSRHRRAQAELAGMVLIAPAVDFTEVLMWKNFPPDGEARTRSQRRLDAALAIRRRGLSDHETVDRGGPRTPSARRHDRDRVPGAHPAGRAAIPTCRGRHAVELVSRLAQDDVVLTLVKDGDHRLSRPEDIERLIDAVREL